MNKPKWQAGLTDDGGSTLASDGVVGSNQVSMSSSGGNYAEMKFSSYTPPENRIALSWSDVNASVSTPIDSYTGTLSKLALKHKGHSRKETRQVHGPSSGQTNGKQILHGTFGIAKPGAILAIIGSSGAGKSTLMTILMGRIGNKLTVTGSVKTNGTVIGRKIAKISAYVQQDDLFHPTLTVYEHLWFHSKLRLSNERYSDRDRKQKIESVLHDLGLSACSGSLIGGQSGSFVGKKTLSGGERKRLAFATELLFNPALFFCDEPTTGLDSFMAENVVQSMKHLAERGKTVVCTLHQPSSQIVNLLDDILVLNEGRVIFTGPVKEVTRYFASIGFDCPSNFNPFDHVIAVLSKPMSSEFHSPELTSQKQDKSQKEIAQQNDETRREHENWAITLSDWFRTSKYYKEARHDIKVASRYGESGKLLEQKIEAGLETASTWTQYKMCTWRQFNMLVRNKNDFTIRIFVHIFIAAIYSIVFANQPYDQRGAMNLCGLCYLLLNIAVDENMDPYVKNLPKETPVYLREQQSQTYSPLIYYVSRMTVEFPQIFGFSLLFVTIIYWSTNMYPTFDRYALAVLIYSGCGWCSSGIGQIMGFLIDNPAISHGVRRGMAPILTYVAGKYVNVSTLPVWISWIRFISPAYYTYELFLVNQWVDVDSLTCNDFDPTRSDYTSSCYKNGESLLDFYTFSVGHVTRNIAALAILTVVFRTIAFTVLAIKTERNKNDG